MTNEQSFFLNTISDHLSGRRTEPTNNICWKTVYEYAKNHQLCSIVYDQCKSFIPDEYKSDFRKQFSSAVYCYSNRVLLMKKIEESFTSASIPFYTVKGLDIASFYPKPDLRTMGDCDIVVHRCDFEKAHRILLDLGFSNTRQGDFEWIYFKNNLEFELHYSLLYEQTANSPEAIAFSQTAWDYTIQSDSTSRAELDHSFHFLFLIIHLKKHLLYSGVGFRQFTDLAVLCQKADLNLEWLSDALKKLNLFDFASVCMSLCEKWFCINMPFSKRIDNEFFAVATEKIFNNGVFGFDDPENCDNLTLFKLRKKNKLGVIINFAFPSYSNVKDVEYYSFVNGKPFLLPVVWVYRYYRLIRYGVNNQKKAFAEDVLKNDKNKQYKEYLEKWGL